MKTEDHLFLGRYLSREFLNSKPVLYRNMFIIGGVLPDINLFSYFRGIITTGKFKGHNYENAEKYIRRSSQKLYERCKYNLLDWLRLGKIIHYTADAFTFVHNNNFKGDLKEHIEYEKRLHLIFLKYFKEVQNVPQVYRTYNTSAPFEYISELHRKYTEKDGEFINDIQNIYTVTLTTMNILTSLKDGKSVCYRSAA